MCADFMNFGKCIRTFEENQIEYLHVDIMDGSFVPNFTLGTDFCKALKRATDIPLDIHLMIDTPEVKLDWFDQFYHNIKCYASACDVIDADSEEVSVKTSLIMASTCKRPLIRAQITYTVKKGEGISIRTDAGVRIEKDIPLPRFGFVYQMPEGFEYLSYFGRGPYESYRDKRHASRIGAFETTVTEHFEPYVRPQENMAHTDTRWVRLANPARQSLIALNSDENKSFSFNASHFTAQQLTETAHDYELTPLKETVVHIDYMQAGIGSASCGPALPDELQLKPEKILFEFRLFPARDIDVCPFDLTK